MHVISSCASRLRGNFLEITQHITLGMLIGFGLFTSACSGTANENEAALPTLIDIDQAATSAVIDMTQSVPIALTDTPPPAQNIPMDGTTATPSPGTTAETTAEIIVASPSPDPSVLQFWQAANGTLTPGEPDTWYFDAIAGDQIAVRVLGIEALLTLQNSAGVNLVSGTSIEGVITEDNRYTVLVEAAEGEDGGLYEIGVRYTDRPNPADLPPTLIPEQVGVPTPRPAYAELGTFISRLTSDTTVGGTFEAESRSHIYVFEGVGGEYVLIEMNRVSGEVDPVVTLYDPDGVPIATDDDSGVEVSARLWNILLPADGTYSIQADGRNLPGSYSIRMLSYEQRIAITPTVVTQPTASPMPTFGLPTPAPAIIGNRLEDHSPVSHTLLQPGDVAIYPVFASQGEVITIAAAPAEGSNLRPVIEVSGPEGNIVAVARSSTSTIDNQALVPNFAAPLEGTYRVFVRGEENSIGGYEIGYGIGSSWRDRYIGTAPFGDRNEATILERGLRHLWTLDLRAGDIITATVNPMQGSQVDPVLELVRDDNITVIAADDNGGGNFSPLLRDVPITETGRYVLRVRSAQPNGIGGYTLIWRYVNAAPTPIAPDAVSLVLSVDDVVNPSEYRFYPFQGFAGQRIRVKVQAQPGTVFDPVSALIGPGGEELIIVDDTDGDLNPVFDFELPADGTYNVRVNGYIQGGGFILTVEQLF